MGVEDETTHERESMGVERMVSMKEHYDAHDWKFGDDWPRLNTVSPLSKRSKVKKISNCKETVQIHFNHENRGKYISPQ